MMNRFRLRPTAAALFVGSALLLAGCGQPGQEPDAAPASAGPEDSAPPSSAAPAPETENATETESAAASPEASSSADASAGDGSCSADQLAASIETEPGAGAAGSVYRTLVLTNTSDSSCTLAGYPGVSYVDAKGKQVGAPADRDSEAKTVTVTVAPGGTAAAQLRQTNAQNYGDECGLTDVAGVKIYPPNRKDSLIAEQETVGCSDESVVLMTVGTFQAP
ncbi:DUF4232 domain-containing protein [Arthrobacter sulfonylureivorans]|uniref:DUF4232 domain-containing protein n=1 Tax=Arthrobacter sulfonylureivorans TaxID=2486855 RepID=UPI0039E71B38